ncbi:antitoxin (DNA-binding transcriptional repressor) of toxin-antitoxin stability system [Knoellia remsis]|uniref:Antitoxin (DNA-binding transcriptional repressor) of toxin-antitoxin stability system n=1 Tax=Knoellia remsis TaxID=407159 RepID=A0A2T0UFE4_9MICO|nr:hypothetical protein [Knoellia remsis]PRY56659.1 antitoxin (DNA-binding transcriptional repressor) of toxin-antitoxin stability system [Knoellia remsis]
MKIVSKRELNQHTAAVLSEVTDADDVVVTERGVPRWRVSTVREAESTLSRLEREGLYTPPAAEASPWPRRALGRRYSEAELGDLLAEMREDH